MELTWIGTAGFIVRSGNCEIAFDPFYSRGEGNHTPFHAKSFENTRAIFVGHGHFDHTFDIPEICQHSAAEIFAPGLTGSLLKFRGTPKERLKSAYNQEYLLKDIKIRGFKSDHVTFDWPLIKSTVKRCGVGGCLHVAKLGLAYPKGLVQSYHFEIAGKTYLFLSTAGCTLEELKQYQKLEVDYLLAPLQGHSEIQSIAADITTIVKPKVVIPHHHDDFYPPLSQEISAEGFADQLKHKGFKGKMLEIPLFDSCQL